MAEKEYIDRHALLDDLDAAMKNSGMGYVIGQTMKRYIKRVPAADVVEVRHGYWYFTEYEYFDCSECGESFFNGCDCTWEAKEKLRTGNYYNYCPNCGAKMKGEQKEDEP